MFEKALTTLSRKQKFRVKYSLHWRLKSPTVEPASKPSLFTSPPIQLFMPWQQCHYINHPVRQQKLTGKHYPGLHQSPAVGRWGYRHRSHSKGLHGHDTAQRNHALLWLSHRISCTRHSQKRAREVTGIRSYE